MTKEQLIANVTGGKGFCAVGRYCGYSAKDARRKAPEIGKADTWVEARHQVMIGGQVMGIQDRVPDGVKAKECTTAFQFGDEVVVIVEGGITSIEYGKAFTIYGRVEPYEQAKK